LFLILRSHYTLEFWGTWEQINIPGMHVSVGYLCDGTQGLIIQ